MFETATWTTRNRRIFSVVELLHQQTGVPINASDPGLDLIKTAGCFGLLSSSIETYAEGASKPRPTKRRMFSAMTPEAGATASVFLTFALAEVLARLGEDVEPQYAAVSEHFLLQPDEVGIIDRELSVIPDDFLSAEVNLSLLAIESATGVRATAGEGLAFGVFPVTSVMPTIWGGAMEHFHPPLQSRPVRAADEAFAVRHKGLLHRQSGAE